MSARRCAVIEAEALIANAGIEGLMRIRRLAGDSSLPEAERRRHAQTAVTAARRASRLQGVDTATRYDIVEQWRRRGSKVR